MVTREPSIERQALLLRAHLAYNAQDVERLLALVGDDVDWPNDEGGGSWACRSALEYRSDLPRGRPPRRAG
jgi:hypothetical protein